MTAATRQLWKSHRAVGWEIARATADDGTELVILQTAPHKQEVVPAYMMAPVDDLAFEAQTYLIQAIEKARFLGLDMDALRRAFDEALNSL